MLTLDTMKVIPWLSCTDIEHSTPWTSDTITVGSDRPSCKDSGYNESETKYLGQVVEILNTMTIMILDRLSGAHWMLDTLEVRPDRLRCTDIKHRDNDTCQAELYALDFGNNHSQTRQTQ